MGRFAILAAILLSSCSSSGSLSREASEACSPAKAQCTPRLAVIAPLEALRASGNELVVSCPESREPLDQNYRESCMRQLANMADTLSARWSDELLPVTTRDMSLSDEHGAVETVSLDGKFGGFDLYYIQAKIPLRWRAK